MCACRVGSAQTLPSDAWSACSVVSGPNWSMSASNHSPDMRPAASSAMTSESTGTARAKMTLRARSERIDADAAVTDTPPRAAAQRKAGRPTAKLPLPSQDVCGQGTRRKSSRWRRFARRRAGVKGLVEPAAGHGTLSACNHGSPSPTSTCPRRRDVLYWARGVSPVRGDARQGRAHPVGPRPGRVPAAERMSMPHGMP